MGLKKKSFSLVLTLLLFTARTSWSSDQALSPYDYKANLEESRPQSAGYGASVAAESTVNMSMVGWGLGIAIGIGLIATFVHQSHEESASHTHAHAHSNPP